MILPMRALCQVAKRYIVSMEATGRPAIMGSAVRGMRVRMSQKWQALGDFGNGLKDKYLEWRRQRDSNPHRSLITRNLLILRCSKCSRCIRCSTSLHLITPKAMTAVRRAGPLVRRSCSRTRGVGAGGIGSQVVICSSGGVGLVWQRFQVRDRCCIRARCSWAPGST